jgi:hypothetical protein
MTVKAYVVQDFKMIGSDVGQIVEERPVGLYIDVEQFIQVVKDRMKDQWATKNGVLGVRLLDPEGVEIFERDRGDFKTLEHHPSNSFRDTARLCGLEKAH